MGINSTLPSLRLIQYCWWTTTDDEQDLGSVVYLSAPPELLLSAYCSLGTSA